MVGLWLKSAKIRYKLCFLFLFVKNKKHSKNEKHSEIEFLRFNFWHFA